MPGSRRGRAASSATGMPVRLGERRVASRRARRDDAVPAEDHRPLGASMIAAARAFALRAGQVRRGSRGRRGARASHAKSHRRLLRVLRDVDEHRPRPARCARRRTPRAACGAISSTRGHQVVVLGDRQRDAGDVRLLEGVGADALASRPAR